jgi:hypothetical protein
MACQFDLRLHSSALIRVASANLTLFKKVVRSVPLVLTGDLETKPDISQF